MPLGISAMCATPTEAFNAPDPPLSRQSRFHFAFKSNSMNSIAIPLCIRKFAALEAGPPHNNTMLLKWPTLHNKVKPVAIFRGVPAFNSHPMRRYH